MTTTSKTLTKRYSKKEVITYTLCDNPQCKSVRNCLICGYCAAHCLTHKGVKDELILGNRTNGEV